MLQAVYELYGQMETYKVRPTVDTYNTLLKACMQHGETKQAMAIFKRLRQSRRGPDVVTYTTLINGFSDAGRPAAAVSRSWVSSDVYPILDGVFSNLALNCAPAPLPVEGGWSLFTDLSQPPPPPPPPGAPFGHLQKALTILGWSAAIIMSLASLLGSCQLQQSDDLP